MYAIKKDPYSNTIGSKYISSASKKTYSYEDTKSDTSFSEKSIEERRIEKQLQQPLVLKDFKHEFDKTETILEYVKGIDSESKAIFEEVKKDNKRYIDYDKIHTIVSTLIAPITTTITTTPIIPSNTINTPITSKDNTSKDNTSNDETSHNDLETLIQLNTKLLTTVNKLVLEVKHIKMELLETTEKLDYISSHVEHLYDKSFIYKKNAPIESIEEKKEEIKIIEEKITEEKITEEKTIEEKTIDEKKVEEKKVEEKTIEVEEIKEEIKEEVKEKEDIEQPETVDVPIEIKEEEKIDIVEEPKQFFKTSASKSVKRLKK